MNLSAWFGVSPADIAEQLESVKTRHAAAMPLLSPAAGTRLLKASETLSYRPARPSVGTGDSQVLQDFEICMEFPVRGPFHELADALTALIRAAVAVMPESPFRDPLVFNDIAVQRYAPGSQGITAHRDHLQYRMLVALVSLAGQGRFFIAEDRDGRNAREIPLQPGQVLLMCAPDFDGRSVRPFHFLRDITERRVVVGLRHDARKLQAFS